MPDPSVLEHFLNAGPYGLCALLLLALIYLYRKLEATHEKRAETAGRVEAALIGAKTAIEALAKTIDDSEARNDERFDVLKDINRQLVIVAQLVGANGDKLGKIESDLIRALIARTGQ